MTTTKLPSFTDLRTRWSPLLDGLPLVPRTLASLAADLAKRHSEPARVYHGLEHIDALAKLYREVAEIASWRTPAEVKLAILFHDAIYEPGHLDNEERSAGLAETYLSTSIVDHVRVAAMIRATKAHGEAEVGTDHDFAHFLDADMAIIGAPGPTYERYAEQVAAEFSKVPSAMYRLGRIAFLRGQLAREQLFHTNYFRARFGVRARVNLTKELRRLEAEAGESAPA